jgi:UDP-glucose 4-epimerase
MSRLSPRTVLVTGALGYIGSHTVVELLLSDLCINVLAVDNLSNSSIEVLDHIHDTVAACTSAPSKLDSSRLHFIEADVRDEDAMRDTFSQSYCRGVPIVAVIHFAAVKSVVESIKMPLKYYRENVGGLTTLLGVMQDWDCKQIIFSSSATVYGSLSGSSRCTEDLCRHTSNTAAEGDEKGIQGCIGLSNAYARTKHFCEAILHDECAAQPDFKAMALRYFNPVGCHPVGLLHESPRGVPGNLVPCIMLAMKEEREMQIYGTDYDTLDGSAVRDFIHVVDLAQGHVASLKKLFMDNESFLQTRLDAGYPWYQTSNSSSAASSTQSSPITDSFAQPDTPPTPSSDLFGNIGVETKPNSLQVYNLGTGSGSTVKEVIAAMRAASGHTIPAVETDRRPGDIECSVADPSKANKELGWYATRTIQDACRDLCRGG